MSLLSRLWDAATAMHWQVVVGIIVLVFVISFVSSKD